MLNLELHYNYLIVCLFSEPSAPLYVRILGSTVTQLKVGWDPPENSNGILKGYYVFYGMCTNSQKYIMQNFEHWNNKLS